MIAAGALLQAPAAAGGAEQRVVARVVSQAGVGVAPDGSLVLGVGSTDAVSVHVTQRRGVRIVTITPKG